MPKPTEQELIAALGTILAEYAEIDCMLDNFAACDPEGMTDNEKRRQRASNRARDKVNHIYRRAVGR